MKIEKVKAIELIEAKIRAFSQLSKSSNILFHQNPYKEEVFIIAYEGAISIIEELFSAEEASSFRNKTRIPTVFPGTDTITVSRKMVRYKEFMDTIVGLLKVYKEKIDSFWHSEDNQPNRGTKKVPFISMSFDIADETINEYFISILKALGIDYVTGESYSKESIPEKVQTRIRSSDLFIVIFVKRDELLSGGFTTPTWLVKELGIAQGASKDVIAFVEKGIKDIAGLNYEKEVIYFSRNELPEVQKATIKFLEAMKVHALV